jgi:hypothetical protein
MNRLDGQTVRRSAKGYFRTSPYLPVADLDEVMFAVTA